MTELPWTAFYYELALATGLLGCVLGLGVAAYREHRQKQAHKVDRFKRIGINYIMREMK